MISESLMTNTTLTELDLSCDDNKDNKKTSERNEMKYKSNKTMNRQ